MTLHHYFVSCHTPFVFRNVKKRSDYNLIDLCTLHSFQHQSLDGISTQNPENLKKKKCLFMVLALLELSTGSF